jgi:formylglycine-generating enzyme required for sulfatase activity
VIKETIRVEVVTIQTSPPAVLPEVKPSVEVTGNTFQDRLSDGSLGPKMVNIPAGSFMMGSKNGGNDEKSVHRVEVATFAMGKYEVTRKEFRQFVEVTGYKTEAEKGDGCYGWIGGEWRQRNEFTWYNAGFPQEETHPVVCVSWNDAIAYTQWLSQKAGKTYRLPTEAEWEYVSRAGMTTNYWWGNTASHEYANYGQDQCCAGLVQGKDRWEFTAPVGSFEPNPFGLYDTAGNVWEWNCSCYESQYSGNELKCDITNNNLRVLRGGSWLNAPDGVRSADRFRNILTARGNDTGLRVVMVSR